MVSSGSLRKRELAGDFYLPTGIFMETLNELYKEPCTCKMCPDCFGTSQVDSVEAGGVSLKPCITCGESGFLTICFRCRQINRLLAEQDTLAMST